jgi:hypothetical protein
MFMIPERSQSNPPIAAKMSGVAMRNTVLSKLTSKKSPMSPDLPAS